MNVHIASKISIFRKFNFRLLKIQLDIVLKKNHFRFDDLIIWITDPFQEGYLNLNKAKVTIFDCYDEYAAQSNNSCFRTQSELFEKELNILNMADLTFVVSEHLYENKRIHSNSIYLVPNGVDTEHFGKSIKNSTLIANDIRHIPKPIIGFLGNLSDRIDFTLLNWLASRNRHWSFVLIGGQVNCKVRKNLLLPLERNNSNVYLLGNKPYFKLPRYLKAFDVCIIPFKQDDLFSLSCSPLKLYEYLATGNPIVSTNLPGVLSLNSYIRIAKSKEIFELEISQALKENCELHEKRIKISKIHSWNERASKVINILENVVNSKMNSVFLNHDDH